MILSLLFSILFCFDNTDGLNNGVALTPIMGWANWERFRCEIDCKTYPNDCINEQLFMEMGDRLANDGWKELGYNIIRIDDCWSLHHRDNITNEQVPDPIRFPNGLKYIADHLHSLGLKLSIYNDIGTNTCAGYTGVDGNYDLDANTFVNWGADMIYMDGCNANKSEMYVTYPLFGQALNKTGKQIIYQCSWPAYIQNHGESINPVIDNTTLDEISKYCNVWRNYNDVQDSWDSVEGIINYWSRNYSNYYNDQFLNVAGPGGWNHPDMLIGGDNGLSISEATTQFCLWAIFAAPLMMGNDLRSIGDEFKVLLQNKEIIDIDQDPMGKQGGVIYHGGTEVIYMRELSMNNSVAIVFQNKATEGFGYFIGFFNWLIPDFVKGWNKNTSFMVRNVLNHTDLGIFDAYFEDLIEPSSVGMYKFTPMD